MPKPGLIPKKMKPGLTPKTAVPDTTIAAPQKSDEFEQAYRYGQLQKIIAQDEQANRFAQGTIGTGVGYESHQMPPEFEKYAGEFPYQPTVPTPVASSTDIPIPVERPVAPQIRPIEQGLFSKAAETAGNVLYPIQHGVQSAGSEVWRMGGNILDLLHRVYGLSPKAAQFMYDRAVESAPEGDVRGIFPKILEGLTRAPIDFATATVAGGGNPLIGFGMMGAASESPENPLRMLLSGARSAATVAPLGGLQYMTPLARMGTGAVIGGLPPAIEGAPLEDIVAGAGTMAIMAKPGGRGQKLAELMRDAERSVGYKQPPPVEPTPKVAPEPTTKIAPEMAQPEVVPSVAGDKIPAKIEAAGPDRFLNIMGKARELGHNRDNLIRNREALSPEKISQLEADIAQNEADLIGMGADPESVLGKVGAEAERVNAKNMGYIAEKYAGNLGIKYNGLQEGIGKVKPVHLFTDSETGSTFSVPFEHPNKVGEYLTKKRAEMTKPAPTSKQFWEMTSDEYALDSGYRKSQGSRVRESWRGQHGGIVRVALEQGKPVPLEVLKDYPDLAAKYAKPAPPVEAAVPKTGTVVPEKGKPEGATGLNLKEIARIRTETGLDELPAPERHKHLAALADAKEKNIDGLRLADEIIGQKRAVSPTEHGAMVLKAIELMGEYDKSAEIQAGLVDKGNTVGAELEGRRKQVVLDQLDRLTEASDYAGTEAGRALSIRRMLLKHADLTPVYAVREAKAAKGKPLTPEETARFEKMATDYQDLKARYEKEKAEWDAGAGERKKGMADRVMKEETRRAATKERIKGYKEKLDAENKQIEKQLADMGFQLNVGIDPNALHLVGKLAVNYIKAGTRTLPEVVKQVTQKLPQLTEHDVYEALNAKSPKEQNRARQETMRAVNDLRTQSRLMLEIDALERGITETQTGAKKKFAFEQSGEVKALKAKLREMKNQAYNSKLPTTNVEKALQTIAELQDQLTNHYRAIKNKKNGISPPEMMELKGKIADLRKAMRVEDNLTRLNEELRTGDFTIRPKPEGRALSPELERMQVELAMARKKVRTAIADQAPKTFGRGVVEGINTLRTLKATADMSYLLRQGLILGAGHPIKAARAFGGSIQAFFSNYKAEQIDNMLRTAPNHYLREKAGLHLPEPTQSLTGREEYFMSNLAERIPGLGQVVKASERNMVTGLNLLRTSVFDDFVRRYPNATTQEMKALANFVNVASGRGDLGKFSGAANVLAGVFFAPRFAVSRFETPYLAWKYRKEPRVRREIARDLVSTAAMGGMVLGLAKLNGAKVGDDPRNSDFGKIVIGGTTHIDIFAGFQQPMRLVTMMGLTASDAAGFTKPQVKTYWDNNDPLELAENFLEYKLSPAVSVPREFVTGRTAVYEKTTPKETAIRAVLPMTYSDLYDAWKLEGPGKAALVGGLNFFGVGTSVYSKKLKPGLKPKSNALSPGGLSPLK
jgi:hypothetical protein